MPKYFLMMTVSAYVDPFHASSQAMAESQNITKKYAGVPLLFVNEIFFMEYLGLMHRYSR